MYLLYVSDHQASTRALQPVRTSVELIGCLTCVTFENE